MLIYLVNSTRSIDCNYRVAMLYTFDKVLKVTTQGVKNKSRNTSKLVVFSKIFFNSILSVCGL